MTRRHCHGVADLSSLQGVGPPAPEQAPKRRVKAKLRDDRRPATRSNETWAMDFVHDQLATGSSNIRISVRRSRGGLPSFGHCHGKLDEPDFTLCNAVFTRRRSRFATAARPRLGSGAASLGRSDGARG